MFCLFTAGAIDLQFGKPRKVLHGVPIYIYIYAYKCISEFLSANILKMNEQFM